MTAWIMECVATTYFSISINGSLLGFFKGKRGLRQGDLLSPYLFTLVMEVLSLLFQRKIRDSGIFSYHKYCDELSITNLCFADDLLIFLRGDVQSAKVVWESLEEFKFASSLAPSLPKSTTYFCNVLNHVKLSILDVLPFEEGRLQLIQTVLSSMYVYWSSVFILPARVTAEIEQMLRGFLWSQGSLEKGKAKVAWDVVSLPNQEGGLGIRNLDIYNVVLMVAHIWNLLALKESLWVKWIYIHRLRGRSFWEVPLRGNLSWSWRKLLQIRPIVRKQFWFMFGNGQNVSAWYDNWAECCPLVNNVTHRMIRDTGYSLHTKVADIVDNGLWKLSAHWDQQVLQNNVPVLQDNSADILKWRSNAGSLDCFSVSLAWEDLRNRAPLVDWYSIV
uniref:uncharacterized protein LOC122610275 n=1 Tax=Erigeron canadensis TaxID=72917 RepID=UPI001CB89CE0|nr:uncharacterized protein LOC122610275 [Erigeron canadensis]